MIKVSEINNKMLLIIFGFLAVHASEQKDYIVTAGCSNIIIWQGKCLSVQELYSNVTDTIEAADQCIDVANFTIDTLSLEENRPDLSMKLTLNNIKYHESVKRLNKIKLQIAGGDQIEVGLNSFYEPGKKFILIKEIQDVLSKKGIEAVIKYYKINPLESPLRKNTITTAPETCNVSEHKILWMDLREYGYRFCDEKFNEIVTTYLETINVENKVNLTGDSDKN